MIYYPSFGKLNKLKVNLLQEEVTEIEGINFFGCYTTQLKDGIYAVTNIVQIPVNLQIFILVKASFFLNGIQISGLIMEVTI